MKKILTAIAVTGLLSGIAFAETVVSSANIVGYVKTQTPEPGSFNIISLVQFSDGSDTVNIQDAIGNMDALNASATWGNADKLITWNGVYNKYGLYQPTEGNAYWMASGIGWNIPAAATPANTDLNRGEGVWYLTGTGGISTNITVSGDVFTDDTFEVDLVGTLTLLSYPYSSAINLTNMVISNATASDSWEDADKIILWNGTYDKYGYYQPAAGEPYWMASGIGWNIPAAAAPANTSVDLGSGFWYQTSDDAKTIEFSKIYTID